MQSSGNLTTQLNVSYSELSFARNATVALLFIGILLCDFFEIKTTLKKWWEVWWTNIRGVRLCVCSMSHLIVTFDSLMSAISLEILSSTYSSCKTPCFSTRPIRG